MIVPTPTKDSPRLRIRGIPPPRPWALRTLEDLTLVVHEVLVDPDVVHHSTSWLSRCDTRRSRQPTTAVSAPYRAVASNQREQSRQMNRSAKDGAWSSPHYGDEGAGVPLRRTKVCAGDT